MSVVSFSPHITWRSNAKGDLISMVGLDQLEEVDLRAIWSHETSDFTPWLAKEANDERDSAAKIEEYSLYR